MEEKEGEIILKDKISKLEDIIGNLLKNQNIQMNKLEQAEKELDQLRLNKLQFEEKIMNMEKEILKRIEEKNKKNHPIGSIYASFDSTSPAVIFGFGVWEQITERFLYCSNNCGTLGGNLNHTHSTGLCIN